MTFIAPVPVHPALALGQVPLFSGCAAAFFRAGRIKHDVFLGWVLLSVFLLPGAFVLDVLPSWIALGVFMALWKLVRLANPRYALILGAVPTLAELLVLLLAPQLLSY